MPINSFEALVDSDYSNKKAFFEAHPECFDVIDGQKGQPDVYHVALTAKFPGEDLEIIADFDGRLNDEVFRSFSDQGAMRSVEHEDFRGKGFFQILHNKVAYNLREKGVRKMEIQTYVFSTACFFARNGGILKEAQWLKGKEIVDWIAERRVSTEVDDLRESVEMVIFDPVDHLRKK